MVEHLVYTLSSLLLLVAFFWWYRRFEPSAHRFAAFLLSRQIGHQSISIERGVIFPAARIALGVIVIVQAGLELWAWPRDLFGLALLLQLAEFIAGILLVLGLGTQYVLIALLAGSWLYSRYFLQTHSLAVDVSAHIAVLLFVAQAGSNTSLDSVIRRLGFSPSLLLYSSPVSRSDIALGRFFALLAYQANSLYSLAMHLGEQVWLTGAVGPLLFTDNYMSRLGGQFGDLFAGNPEVMILFRIAMYLQMFWFATIIPFYLLGGPFRKFTLVWGYLFFLSSLIILQLNSLAWVELIFWTVIFLPSIGKPKPLKGEDADTVVPVPKRNTIAIYSHSAFVFSIFLLALPLPFLPINNPLSETPVHKLAAPHGVKPINVFNSTDLRMRENWYTVETPGGQLLPIYNLDGSRAYLHNIDSIYYGNTLRFARGEIDLTDCGLDRHEDNIRMGIRQSRAISGTEVPQEYLISHFRQTSPSVTEILQGQYREVEAYVVCTRVWTVE